MRYLKPLLVALLLAGIPAAALASQPATRGQKAAVLRALGNRATPSRCLTVRVSTANRSWAELYSSPTGAGAACPGAQVRREGLPPLRVALRLTGGAQFAAGGAARVTSA